VMRTNEELQISFELVLLNEFWVPLDSSVWMVAMAVVKLTHSEVILIRESLGDLESTLISS